MKKCFIITLIVSIIVFSKLFGEEITLFDVKLNYETESDWNFFEHSYNPVNKTGTILYKRNPVQNKDEEKIIPSLSIFYEYLNSDSNDVIAYSMIKRMNWPKYKIISTFASGNGPVKYGLGYEIEMEYEGRIQRAYIIHMIIGKIGFQLIGNSTNDVFDQIKSELKKAFKSIEYEIVNNKESSEELIKKGYSYYERMDVENAIGFYNQVLQNDSLYADAYYYRALVLGRIDMMDAAERDFNSAININPKDPYYYGDRAVLYSMTERYNEAVKDYETAIKLDPNNPSHYYNLATCHRQFQHKDLSLKFLSKAIEIQPENPVYKFERAMFLTANEKIDDAISDFEDVVKFHKQNKDAENYPMFREIFSNTYYILGKIKFDAGDKKTSKKYLELAKSFGSFEAQELLSEF